MKRKSLVFLIYVVLGLCFNFQNNALRMLFILSWAFIPLLLVFNSNDTRIKKNKLYSYYNLFWITCTLFFSFILNANSFELELNGPTVEKLTPFLGFMTLPFFFIFGKFENHPTARLRIISIWLILLFFIIDAVYRYMKGPDLFMNYYNRHAAKTIGLLATTNVNGQSLSVLFSCILVTKIKHKLKLLIIIFILLLTAMARAAIVAVIISTGMYLLAKSRAVYKLMAISFALTIISFFALDPFNLSNDGSFLSKLEFINSTVALLSNAELAEIMFGFGLNYETITDTLGVKGWSPHLPILKGFLYFGVFGVLYFIISNFLIYRINNRVFYPLVTYLILSFAGAPLFWPGLFSISLITLSSQDENDYYR